MHERKLANFQGGNVSIKDNWCPNALLVSAYKSRCWKTLQSWAVFQRHSHSTAGIAPCFGLSSDLLAYLTLCHPPQCVHPEPKSPPSCRGTIPPFPEPPWSLTPRWAASKYPRNTRRIFRLYFAILYRALKKCRTWRIRPLTCHSNGSRTRPTSTGLQRAYIE